MNEDKDLRLLKERRSIRSYDSRPIDDEILTKILDTSRWCWSAVNRQPWKIYVIRNSDLISQIAKECTTGPFAAEAPVLIALVGDIEAQPNWYVHDLSFLSLQLALAAWAYGIGTCFIGNVNRDNVKKILGLHEKDFLLTVLPLGYPSGNIPKARPRKPLDEIVKYFD
ncbi:MAG: nitroreductase family protein [Candidatus Lokiarchaeota archaeon]|nr:nitroreductase family protein [Candidatus Lokiarchaeota archaeon]